MIDLDGARYVALTTFKKDGTPIATPVWITGSNGIYAFTTGDNAWKSKRLNNNPEVTVQVSDFRGRVKPNTRVYTGTGRVDPGLRLLAGCRADLFALVLLRQRCSKVPRTTAAPDCPDRKPEVRSELRQQA